MSSDGGVVHNDERTSRPKLSGGAQECVEAPTSTSWLGNLLVTTDCYHYFVTTL